MAKVTKWLVAVAVAAGTHSFAVRPAAAQQADGPRQTAAAVPAREAALETRVVGRSWYGWKTLTVDAAAGGLFTYGALLRPRPSKEVPEIGKPMVLVLASTGLLLGAPIVHFSEGRRRAGAASLGLRVVLPLLGYGIAKGAGGSDDAKLAAFAAGMGTAALIDGAVLAWKPRIETRRVTVVPSVTWDGARGGTLGVAGAF